jgi:hypothetical protein
VIGTCNLAGWKPPLVAATLEPAGAEDPSKRALPATIVPIFGAIFTDGPVRLQAEAMRKLAEIDSLIPAKLLPKALDSGRRSVALREHLLPVLGRRGAWLAAQNESWSFAAGGSGNAEMLDDELWAHGSLDQRKLYLTKLHELDAAKARELLAAALSTEGARERTAFLECLSPSLSLADEDLLEASLTDKSKEVRRVAALFLMSLPESRYVQRMVARLQPCLTMEKKLLRGTVVTLEPPATFDPAWKNDMDEAKPKGSAMGERALWLLQIVAGVPLPWWESHTGMKPAELIKWAQKSDWKDALLKGWAAAQALQHRVEWAEAFLSELPRGAELNPQDLLDTLPLPLREKHFLKLFSAGEAGQTASGSAMLDRFLAGIPFDAPPLSAECAKALIQLLKRRINHGETRYDWQLRTSLVELACVIPASLFDECANGWDLTKEEVQPFAEAIARLGIVLDQRKQLLQINLKPET